MSDEDGVPRIRTTLQCAWGDVEIMASSDSESIELRLRPMSGVEAGMILRPLEISILAKMLSGFDGGKQANLP